MTGARTVTRVTTGDRPGLHAFEVDRAGRGPLLVIWDHRDPFDGEDEPPVEVTWPWPAASATVTDVFGRTGPPAAGTVGYSCRSRRDPALRRQDQPMNTRAAGSPS